MGTRYEQDVVAWANEQAALLRSGNLSAIDIEHIAEEIEDVGKSEQRELANRMAVLMAHLLKWQFQSGRRCSSWEITINVQRRAVCRLLKQMPSLKPMLTDNDWIEAMWGDATDIASRETGIGNFPETCQWSMEQLLLQAFFPD